MHPGNFDDRLNCGFRTNIYLRIVHSTLILNPVINASKHAEEIGLFGPIWDF